MGEGVGGLGWACTSANASGTFPAASRSKGDSTSSSADARKGGAGSGLFTLVIPWGEGSAAADSELAFGETTPNGEPSSAGLEAPEGVPGREPELAPKSILMSLPCRELGGGGFLRAEADGIGANGEEGNRPLRSSDASDSDISWDVRGVSCGASKTDCLEIELVSVALAPSGKVPGPCAVAERFRVDSDGVGAGFGGVGRFA